MRIVSPIRPSRFHHVRNILVLLAVGLNVGWIVLTGDAWFLSFWALFSLERLTGLVLNTIFLVREIRRNEQQDSFLNAVTTN